jgi:hypothetical protein
MGDFPQSGTFTQEDAGYLSVAVSLVGLENTIPISTAWPSANLAIFVPMRVAVPVTVYKLAIGAGATAAGNFDVGIYDRFGNKLVSSGATAKAGSVEQIIDVTDTRIGPGLYYLALAADGTNNYICRTASNLQFTKAYGVLNMSTAYVLPATATFAAATSAVIPMIAAYLRPY